MRAEKQNLFNLIESWEEGNIKIALQIIKNNNELKSAAEERYMPLLSFVDAKSLASLKSLPKKLSTPKFLKKQWFPDIHSQAVLQTIPIDEIVLGNRAMTVFPEWICYLSKLRILDVRNSDSWRAKNPNKLEVIPEAIEHLQGLEELYISRVKLEKVPDSLTKLTGLKVLDLHYNQITTLPDLSPLKNLKILHLFINRLTEIKGVEHLRELEFLDLGANELSTLIDNIDVLEQLRVLNLCSNKIKTLPDALCNLRYLEKLDIYSLPLNGQLPRDFVKLNYLPWLRLDNIGLPALPSFLKAFKNLKTFRCKLNDRFYEFSRKPIEIQAFLEENIL